MRLLAVMMCGPVRAKAGENVTKIVAAGGRRYDGGSLNTVEIYDITLDTWSTGMSAIVTRGESQTCPNNIREECILPASRDSVEK